MTAGAPFRLHSRYGPPFREATVFQRKKGQVMAKGSRRAFSMMAGMLAVLIADTAIVEAQQKRDPRVADIIATGKIRIALGLGSPALAMKDPTTGEVHGPALDLGHALAMQIGVQLQPVEYPTPGVIMEGLRNNAWDVAFVVINPDRAALVDYSPPYMQSDFTFLVPAGSAIHHVADADQPGVRIAVPRGDASDSMLSKTLKRAELVRADNVAAALDLLRTRQVGAFAMTRTVLLALAPQAPGSQVLADGFGLFSYAAAIPKGKAGHLAAVSQFIEQAKASGLVEQTIKRAGLRGLQVAPPAKLD
jgi:polar amino acid transport system substrate-binding protein